MTIRCDDAWKMGKSKGEEVKNVCHLFHSAHNFVLYMIQSSR